MTRVHKIKEFLENFDFIPSHSAGEVKIFQKTLRFSAIGIRSNFN